MTPPSRRLRISALAASAMFALAACGGGAEGDTTSDSSAAGLSAPEPPAGCEAKPASDEEGTHTVKDTMLGDIEDVPKNPKRVIALWRTGAELADLCFMPVGTIDVEFTEIEIGDFAKEFEDVPRVGTTEGVDLEKVIAAEPDLIVGMDHGGLSIDYKELQEVAPTVILNIEEPTDVWENYPDLAAVVNRSTDYEERESALDDRLAEIKDEYGDDLADLKVSSLTYSDQLYIDTSKSLTYQRLTAAGFGYNSDYTESPKRYVEELTLENLPDLADQDIIFVEAEFDGKPNPDLQKVIDSASFQRLPAVKAGHVYNLGTGTSYTFEAGNAQADDLEAAAKAYTGK